MIDNNNNSKISVMLVDDHPMVQGGLTACLAFYDDIEIVGATDDGAEALSKAKELKPDVIIMDVSMPKMNGIDATEIISEQLPDTRVLIFSMHDRPEFVRSAIDAGASGYVLKDTSSEEVYFAIKAVAKGNTHFSSSISKMLIENPMKADNERLTTRESKLFFHMWRVAYQAKKLPVS
ncbi:response regulator [Colwellia sp. 20A7]|uniref:response regulator n=1 Tax=Colwellia sp. 20A7 TaxID=2689569 RepID=UPI001F1DA0B0|nr:response regulator transcription factor [Colwellia sp. 20A7]